MVGDDGKVGGVFVVVGERCVVVFGAGPRMYISHTEYIEYKRGSWRL